MAALAAMPNPTAIAPIGPPTNIVIAAAANPTAVAISSRLELKALMPLEPLYISAADTATAPANAPTALPAMPVAAV